MNEFSIQHIFQCISSKLPASSPSRSKNASYANITPGIQYQPFNKNYFSFTVPLSWQIYGHEFVYIDNHILTDEHRHDNHSRRQIAFYFEIVLNTGKELIIRDKNKKVVMMSLNEFNSLKETAYLLAFEKNRRHLSKSLNQAPKGKSSTLT